MGVIDRIKGFFEDPLFKGGKALAHMAGKAGIKGGAELLVPVALSVESAEVIGTLNMSLIVAPVAAVLSSALVIIDYFRKKELLLEQYRPQISVWLAKQGGGAKKPAELTHDDLDLAAFGDGKRGIEAHPVLKETLEQNAKERVWGVAISALSSIASTIIIGGLMHDFLYQDFAGEKWLNFGIRALIGGAVGFAMYLPITAGLHWLAESLFGLEKETANDHVKAMLRARERGQEISPEQVLETFVKANPELDREIKAAFGRRLFKMNEAQRAQVLEMVEPKLGIRELTRHINSGALKPEDLAFVDPKAWARQQEQKPVVAAEAIEAQTPEREISFVQMVGRKQDADGSRSFAQAVGRREAFRAAGSYEEVVEQSRSGEPNPARA